jgi:hypothetical protein
MDEHPRLKLLYYLALALSGFFAGLGAIMLMPNTEQLGWLFFILGLTVGVGLIVLDYIVTIVRLNPLKLASSIKDSKVVWAFWQAGGIAKLNNVIEENKPSSISKLMLLKPDINEPSFQFIISLAGRDTPNGINQQISEINEMTKLARSTGTEVLYHTEPLAYTFTIFDKSPDMTDRTNPLPNSKNAWIVVQALEPKRKREIDKWHKWVIRNKGETKQQFEAYFKLFQQVEKKIRDKESSKKLV